MTPEQLTERLAAAVPTQLRCVVLYGSAVAGDFLPEASNYNLLVLVEPLSIAALDILSPLMAEWRRAGHAPPLLFTPAGFMASTDAFPIEVLDIQQSRRVLWGKDLLAEMNVHPEHLRLQVERELTGKLLSLRRRYLLTEGKSLAVTELMLHTLSPILVLFRATLRLYQQEIPTRKLDALHALRKYVTFDVEPFEHLFALKEHPRPVHAAPPVKFESYLQAIEQVAAAVDLKSQPPRSDP